MQDPVFISETQVFDVVPGKLGMKCILEEASPSLHKVIVPANLILPTAEASYEILTQRHGSCLTLSLTKQSHDTAESVC